MSEVANEDDPKRIFVSSISETVSVTAGYVVGPDDDGTAGVREPLRPDDAPPSLAAERDPNDG